MRVGGPWVRCYGGFHPAGDPLKDVTRLAILCGPENGMKRLSTRALEGVVNAGAAAVSEAFDARRGECFRIFAVAEPSVADLDVVVRSSRGAPIAADHGEDAWPIVQPDRPFCALEDDRYTFEVSARKGSGRFAAEVWVLHAPAPAGHAPHAAARAVAGAVARAIKPRAPRRRRLTRSTHPTRGTWRGGRRTKGSWASTKTYRSGKRPRAPKSMRASAAIRTNGACSSA